MVAIRTAYMSSVAAERIHVLWSSMHWCVPCPVYLASHVLRSHMSCVSDFLCAFFTCPFVPYVLCVRFPVCLLHMSFRPICLVCTMGHKAHRGMGYTRPTGLKDMGHTRHMGPRHTGHGTHKTYGTKGHRTHGAMKDKGLNSLNRFYHFELGCLLWLHPIATASGRVSTTKILCKHC